jgi:hypothetical protein
MTPLSICNTQLNHVRQPTARRSRDQRAGLHVPKPAAPECLPRVPPEMVHVLLSTESNSPLQ